MFHLSDNDIVTIIAECAAKTVRHQIDGFGGAFDKIISSVCGALINAAAFCRTASVAAVASALNGRNAAVNRGIMVSRKITHRINHLLRFLGAGGTVEVDQWFAVHLPPVPEVCPPLLC